MRSVFALLIASLLYIAGPTHPAYCNLPSTTDNASPTDTTEFFGPYVARPRAGAELSLSLETDLGVIAPRLQANGEIAQGPVLNKAAEILKSFGVPQQLTEKAGAGHAAPYL